MAREYLLRTLFGAGVRVHRGPWERPPLLSTVPQKAANVLWTLAVSALASGAAAAVYAGVAHTLWRREVPEAARGATRAFSLYWAATGAFLALSAAQSGLAAVGVTPLAFFVAARYVGLGLACAGLAALLYYFAYLRTGERRWLPRIAALYAGGLALAWYHVHASGPTGVSVARWSTDLAYATPMHGPLFILVLVLILGLPVVAAGWYLTLLRTVDDARQRYRIVVVALGIGLQLVGVLLARLSEADLFQLLVRPVAGVVVAGLVLSAFVEREPSA